jgi:hypothetical protein
MTLRRFPSAIYHCDLPVGSAGTFYGSSVNARERRRTPSSHPPILAWPDIKRTDQWCCFPGLFRAIYIYDKDQEREYDPNIQYVLKHSQTITQVVLYQVALIMPHNWWGVAGRRP